MSIDESDIATAMNKYSNIVIGKVNNKTERGKTWFESSLFWGRFEILLTGGLTSGKNTSDIAPVLGPKVPFKELFDNDSFISEHIYMNHCLNGIESKYQIRNLRNWVSVNDFTKKDLERQMY